MTTLHTRPSPATSLPRTSMSDSGPEPTRMRVGRSAEETRTLVGAVFSGISMAMLIGPVLGLVGIGWVPLLTFVWFVAIYTTLIALTEEGPAVRDRFWSVLIWSAGSTVVALLFLVIGYTLYRGWDVFKNLRSTFLTDDMSLTGPLSKITDGGILYAIVGTVEQIGIALIITVPLGIATAVFLNEVGGRYARLVRTVVEAMTALPSVVAGLFIYASVILLFTKEFNGFAAALAISVLMLPIMIRSADVVLRLVPGNLREAGLALGGGQWSVVRLVVLPTVRSGLTTAIILGTAHGIGETAPVLLTAGVTGNLNFNPFSNPQTSLPLAALEFIKSPQADMKARGFATAAVLLVLVMILFIVARLIGGQQAGQITDRQRRRLGVRSRRDLGRIDENHASVQGVLATTVTARAAGDTSQFPHDRNSPPATSPGDDA